MRAISLRHVAALCASLLSLALLPSTAAATASQDQIDGAIDTAVEYVGGQQNPDTGEPFGFEHGSFSSDWVATSLAAAGVSAADVRAPGNPSLQDFLLADYTDFWAGPPVSAATNYERATLVSHAAGLDPARLSADLNLHAQVAGTWNPIAGSFGEPSINSTVFGILAMRTAPLPVSALAPATAFLRQRQHDDGGWTFSASTSPATKAEPSEPDMTGAAIAALCEAGAPAYDPAVAGALAYLKTLLVESTGAFHYAFGDNADATAWAISGLNACGLDPQSKAWTTAAGKTPVDHLLSLQVQSGPEAGGFGYENASEANLYSTQDALRALSGGVFTATPPNREDPSLPSVRGVPVGVAGTPVPHVLTIELAPGNVRMCQVTAPAEAPLTQVLSAAKGNSYPVGCVSSLAVSAGELSSLNGVSPDGHDQTWLLRLDRGVQAVAGQQPVGFGDAVSLRIGERPGVGESVPGPAGAFRGPAGDPGAQGRRGARGKAGRNIRPSCRKGKVRQRRFGKHRIRCSVKHQPRGAKRR
jgi:hypothetical protein